jgi:hypothetical protein
LECPKVARLVIDEFFSSCRSGLKLSVLKDSDRLDEPSRIVVTAAELPQELSDLELGECALASAV